MREKVPDHSWLSKTRSRPAHEAHEKMLGWAPGLVAGRGRRKSGEDAAASVVGVRQGHRERTLTVPSRINRTIGSSASERPFQASPCARSTDGAASPKNLMIRSLTSPHDRIASSRPKTRQQIPTQIATGPRIGDDGSKIEGQRGAAGRPAPRHRRDPSRDTDADRKESLVGTPTIVDLVREELPFPRSLKTAASAP